MQIAAGLAILVMTGATGLAVATEAAVPAEVRLR
jgi:hypothetical protein